MPHSFRFLPRGHRRIGFRVHSDRNRAAKKVGKISDTPNANRCNGESNGLNSTTVASDADTSSPKGTQTVSDKRRHPLLDRLYLRYLDDEDSAGFIAAVSKHYSIATLERLADCGQYLARRGAVLALGYLGGFASNPAVARALRDSDRVVRILAENGIFELWCRDGSDSQQQQMRVVVRLNDAQQFDEAHELASQLIDEAPQFAEAWNQRAIASYRLGHYEEAANDCQQTLELNPCHFAAALGMAHCYLELGEGLAALDCFRRALDLNPNLDSIRGQIEYLERALEET
jgi:tetratricopeptide (TPR) repeat protein